METDNRLVNVEVGQYACHVATNQSRYSDVWRGLVAYGVLDIVGLNPPVHPNRMSTIENDSERSPFGED